MRLLLAIILSSTYLTAAAATACHFECKDPSQDCNDEASLIEVCQEAEWFSSQGEIQTYITELTLLGVPFPEAQAKLKKYNFYCATPNKPENTWQCGRVVMKPECAADQQQVIVILLQQDTVESIWGWGGWPCP